MPVRFMYIDESYDAERYCLSAISIRHSQWMECFEEIRRHRQNLKAQHGLYIRKEIHARDLVAGRGDISSKVVGKWDRSRIFLGLLQLVARLPGVLLFNVCIPVKGCADPQLMAWDRIINRIERTMLEFDNRELAQRGRVLTKIRPHLSDEDANYIEARLNLYRSRAFIISDEGRENEIIKSLRKKHVINYIPSRYGEWSSGSYTKNIITERIIEDPVFKPSHRSHFLQLADCVAFALLKREVAPTPNIKKYGIHKMFEDTLPAVCYVKASPRDPCGIVRN